MNKLLSKLFALVLVFNTSLLLATNVPIEQAKTYAKTVFAMKSTQNIRSFADIGISEEYTRLTKDKKASYYIFNMEPTGFVIISADDSYNPVLAFSDESRINFDNEYINAPMFNNLGRHELKIEHLRNNDILPSKQVQKEWKAIKDADVSTLLSTKSQTPDGVVVSPLTTTTWNQGEFYNAWTPRDPDPESVAGGTYCGCAPIAMAQLIKFHNYPPSGNGDISYEDPNYGEQTADFCSTNYNWANMPDSLSSENDDVARFIYQVGVSTRTSYSITYSETFVSYMRDALVHFFKYDESASWFYDGQGDFARVAIDDLNQGRPLILTGQAPNNGGGHMWVTDGYGYFLDPAPNQPDEYFHFNWGWGGDNNGWFLDTGGSWAPVPGEFGTQVITYYYDRYVVHNVKPSTQQCGAPRNSTHLGITSYYTSGVSKDAAYLHYTESSIQFDQEVQYRWRKVGTTQWTTSLTLTANFHRAVGLEAESEYEFQVRRKCCGNDWSDYSESYEFETKPATPPGSSCNTLLASNLTTSNVGEESTYVYTSTPYGTTLNQFRYRFAGSAIWVNTDIQSSYYRFLSGLEAGTDYEFQVRHQCDQTVWSEWSSEIGTFTTQGNVGCGAALDVNLFTSSVTTTGGYIYTTQPYGRVDNQFRYRATGTSDWIMSSINDGYYRYLSNLQPGTEYEFQVAHLCQPNTFTDWSFSRTFTTQGGVTSACDAINGERLYNSSISNSGAYVYTPQPFGNVANQFRYRTVGNANWTLSTVSTLYYRYISGLSSNTTYEFQVIHECSPGTWSPWSTSKTFVTSAFAGGGGPGLVLPSAESTDFREAMLDDMTLSVYPNPVQDYLTVKSSVDFYENSTIQIMNLRGKLLYQQDMDEGREFIVPVSDFENGIYLVQYFNGYENFIEKFIKI